MVGYREFIKSVIKINTVLEKRFFSLFLFPPSKWEYVVPILDHSTKNMSLLEQKPALYPKRDNLLRLITKIGLKGSILQRQELTELYYNLYNPSATGRRLAPIESYTDVICVKKCQQDNYV